MVVAVLVMLVLLAVFPLLRIKEPTQQCHTKEMVISENRGPQHSTLNSRILIIRIPQNKVPPKFRKLPNLPPRGIEAAEGVVADPRLRPGDVELARRNKNSHHPFGASLLQL